MEARVVAWGHEVVEVEPGLMVRWGLGWWMRERGQLVLQVVVEAAM